MLSAARVEFIFKVHLAALAIIGDTGDALRNVGNSSVTAKHYDTTLLLTSARALPMVITAVKEYVLC